MISGLALLLALAGCDGRNLPPPQATATPLATSTPTVNLATPAANTTGDPAQPDYTPVTLAGGVPYVPPEPWLVAPTALPGQATPTPYGGPAAPGRIGGNNKKPSPTPKRKATASPQP